MEKCCVIDIGTNSIRMLISRLEDGYISYSKKFLRMTRMGEGVDKTKILQAAAIDRSITALKEFKDEALREGIKTIKAIATSAVRDAVNRDEFIKRAKEELNLDIEIISGEKEAELGFIGVIKGVDKRIGSLFVIDIGGGSTELIIGDDRGIRYSRSLDVGAVRMTNKHITTDPITELEMCNLRVDIRNIIGEEIDKIKKVEIEEVAGIGGTVTSLAAIAQGLKSYDRNKVHNYELRLQEINDMIYRFKKMSNDERKKIQGLQPKRADIILAGTMILYEILRSLNIEKIRISEYDNLEGYIYSSIGVESP